MGKNNYLKDYNQFNPWISFTGHITWVPEIRLHTSCNVQVKKENFLKYHI